VQYIVFGVCLSKSCTHVCSIEVESIVISRPIMGGFRLWGRSLLVSEIHYLRFTIHDVITGFLCIQHTLVMHVVQD